MKKFMAKEKPEKTNAPEVTDLVAKNNPWLKQISKFDRVYISGPMTGYPDNNIPAFRLMEHVLKPRCEVVFSPANITQNRMYHTMLREALFMALHCNVMIMLSGWELSNGANIEWTIGTQMMFRIYYQLK